MYRTKNSANAMQRSEIEEATADILMIVEVPCVYTRDILDSHPGSRPLWHVAW